MEQHPPLEPLFERNLFYTPPPTDNHSDRVRIYIFIWSNYSGRHHLDATNKMILYPLPHKSIEKKFFLLDSD